MIPIARPLIGEAGKQAVPEVLESGMRPVGERPAGEVPLLSHADPEATAREVNRL